MKKLQAGLATLLLLVFSSCSLELSFTLKNDNSLDVTLEAGGGESFTKMLFDAAGVEDSAIDVKQLESELSNSGFTNVQCENKGDGDSSSKVQIKFTDAGLKSYIFTSGLLLVDGGKLELNLAKEKLVNFYNVCDEQTRMLLDLFLAPVFNDESMTEEEYLEMLGTFYGQSCADEIKSTDIKIRLTDCDKTFKVIKIPLSSLMCTKD